ncbi:MAG: SAM-dependent methyltransferase [Lentisphaerae bacterium GWF2_52_8]|nr:MAG: SAM-dependent methyltransferase [Lentisphaerae bacterium GWF2_52_8]
MTITYNEIKPWGRSLAEYVKMFNLTADELKLSRILGCGDGPASFNAELSAMGGRVISVDPIYQFSGLQINQRIKEIYDDVISQTEMNKDKFVWKEISSVEELGRIRQGAMSKFLDDFEKAPKKDRYVCSELPFLPFREKEFDLALCSHFLFLYSDNLSLDFHLGSLKELCRVAKEVRIFPLVDLNAKRSAYIAPSIALLKSEGIQATEETVPYEFQKGGNTMLRIRR